MGWGSLRRDVGARKRPVVGLACGATPAALLSAAPAVGVPASTAYADSARDTSEARLAAERDGACAIYADVRKTAEAAANPDLKKLDFSLKSEGLTGICDAQSGMVTDVRIRAGVMADQSQTSAEAGD